MASDPFTIRIFVPDGDPEGVRVIDRMNWTGKGVVFPREKWSEARLRPEFGKPGIYILRGVNEEEDLPTLYIGQGEEVRTRIDEHHKNKLFWTHGIAFVSANNGLNRGHITWLEFALIEQAYQVGQCLLDNGAKPQEPILSESEKADTKGFLKEIMQILPLVGFQALEKRKPVATPHASLPEKPLPSSPEQIDTIIVPAQKEGFQKVFIGEDAWYAIRISAGMLPKLKYIAAYQSAPVSAITHYAPIDSIEPYGESGKYRVVFSEKAKAIGPIPFADTPGGMMQGPRYSNLQKLQSATKVGDCILKT